MAHAAPYVHDQMIKDLDDHFRINDITRTIEPAKHTKNVLVQGDHNSERYTFEIKRYVEGHDNSVCDRIKVHYLNIGKSGDTSPDVYEVTDAKIATNPDGDEYVIFSWLISRNATRYEGNLNFAIEMLCFDNEEVPTYSWHTEIYTAISVHKGLSSSASIVEEYSDILETWKQELFTAPVNLKNEIEMQLWHTGEEVRKSLPESYLDFTTKQEQKLNDIVKVYNAQPNEADIPKDNRIWLAPGQKFQVPSYDEFTAVKEDLDGLAKGKEGTITGRLSESITDLKEDLELAFTPLKIIENEYVETNGEIKPYQSWGRTDYTPINFKVIKLISPFAGRYCALYDENRMFIKNFTLEKGDNYIYAGNAKYFICSAGKTDIKKLQYEFFVKTQNDSKCFINREDENTLLLHFGDGEVLLFKNVDSYSNSNNWNIGTLSINGNVVIPKNTDIIGPVLINDNVDYVGGVHGDEKTISIDISMNGRTFKASSIVDFTNPIAVVGNNINVIMTNEVFDETTKNKIFDRVIQLHIEPNKIIVSNSFNCVKSCILKRATNGGLLACYSDIINSIALNNKFYQSVPAESDNVENADTVYVTINTIYGSLSVINLIGHNKETYGGWLSVFNNESRPRCKIYLDTYKQGTYPLSVGDCINGCFEILIS